jgi:hypothetical protein
MVQVRDLIEPTVRFYRTPGSLFPSGEAALALLRERKISSHQEIWYWAEMADAKEWVSAQNLIYLREFKLQTPDRQTGILIATSRVLRHKNGWRPGEQLHEGTSLIINSVRSDWACGSDSKGDVCVPSDKILLAIDAAKRVQSNLGKWHSVKYRVRHQMLTENDQVIPLNNIKAWENHPNAAFIRPIINVPESIKSRILSPPAYARVLLLKKEFRRWNQSILSDHGNVWWQNSVENSNSAPILLTKEELLNRKTYDQAKRGLLALTSAEGVFFSKDGEIWTLLKQFGEGNHPVTIGPRNTLVVGDQLSFDEGKTFQNYLRWDQITLQSQKILRHPPKHLRLQAVKAHGRSSLLLEVDTGYKILIFEFNTINSQISYTDSRLNR